MENDTGMAQVLAGERGERVGRLILSSCEAFDNYPPGVPGRSIALAAKVPGGVGLAMNALKLKPLRRLPMTFGSMSKRGVPDDVFAGWMHGL